MPSLAKSQDKISEKKKTEDTFSIFPTFSCLLIIDINHTFSPTKAYLQVQASNVQQRQDKIPPQKGTVLTEKPHDRNEIESDELNSTKFPDIVKGMDGLAQEAG